MKEDPNISIISVYYWVTIDGDTLKVSEMSTEHIENCIALIEKRNNWRKDYLKPLKLELMIRTTKLGKVLYGP